MPINCWGTANGALLVHFEAGEFPPPFAPPKTTFMHAPHPPRRKLRFSPPPPPPSPFPAAQAIRPSAGGEGQKMMMTLAPKETRHDITLPPPIPTVPHPSHLDRKISRIGENSNPPLPFFLFLRYLGKCKERKKESLKLALEWIGALLEEKEKKFREFRFLPPPVRREMCVGGGGWPAPPPPPTFSLSSSPSK